MNARCQFEFAAMASRSLLAVVIAVMAGAVVAGVLALGSPAHQRERRLDQQRISHLAEIAQMIEIYQLQEKVLPTTLAFDGDSRRAPRDPLTAQPYEYTVIDANRYQLCAMFQQPLDDGPVFWRHGIGRTCFAYRARAEPP